MLLGPDRQVIYLRSSSKADFPPLLLQTEHCPERAIAL